MPYSTADAVEFLSCVDEGWRDSTVLTFATVYRGRFAGSLDLRSDGGGAADVGYWIRAVGTWQRCDDASDESRTGVRGLVEQRGERHDGWIGSLLRGDPLSGEPDEPPG